MQKDHLLLCQDPGSKFWVLEKHGEAYHTMREPTRKKSQDETDARYITVDGNTRAIKFEEDDELSVLEPQPQITDKTRYLAVDEETKAPILVEAEEYHTTLIIPHVKLNVANARVYKTASSLLQRVRENKLRFDTL